MMDAKKKKKKRKKRKKETCLKAARNLNAVVNRRAPGAGNKPQRCMTGAKESAGVLVSRDDGASWRGRVLHYSTPTPTPFGPFGPFGPFIGSFIGPFVHSLHPLDSTRPFALDLRGA